MVDDVYALLRAQHFGPRSVIREKYVFAVQEKAAQGPARSSADEALLQQKMKVYGATPATDPKPPSRFETPVPRLIDKARRVISGIAQGKAELVRRVR